MLLVAVGLGKDAATVFLHVEAEFPRFLVAGAEVGAEIPVEELHAVLLGIFFGGLRNAVMILIETGQQGGGKGGESVLCCVAGGAFDPVVIAVRTSVVDII